MELRFASFDKNTVAWTSRFLRGPRLQMTLQLGLAGIVLQALELQKLTLVTSATVVTSYWLFQRHTEIQNSTWDRNVR
jgi:hypothetical protein